MDERNDDHQTKIKQIKKRRGFYMKNIINELIERISEEKPYQDVLEKFKKEEKKYELKELAPMFEQAMEEFIPEKFASIVNILMIERNEKIMYALAKSDKIYYKMKKLISHKTEE